MLASRCRASCCLRRCGGAVADGDINCGYTPVGPLGTRLSEAIARTVRTKRGRLCAILASLCACLPAGFAMCGRCIVRTRSKLSPPCGTFLSESRKLFQPALTGSDYSWPARPMLLHRNQPAYRGQGSNARCNIDTSLAASPSTMERVYPDLGMLQKETPKAEVQYRGLAAEAG